MTTAKLLRWAWRLNRAERMIDRPDRYVKNRAKSRALRSTGFYRGWNRWWRA